MCNSRRGGFSETLVVNRLTKGGRKEPVTPPSVLYPVNSPIDLTDEEFSVWLGSKWDEWFGTYVYDGLYSFWIDSWILQGKYRWQ